MLYVGAHLSVSAVEFTIFMTSTLTNGGGGAYWFTVFMCVCNF